MGELVKSPNVAARAAKELGRTPADMGAAIDYRVAEDTNLLEVSVEAGNPSTAARVANAVARAYVDENAASLAAQSAAAEKRLTDKLASLKQRAAELQKELAAARATGKTARVSTLQDQISAAQISYQDVQEDLQSLAANEMKMAVALSLADQAKPSRSPTRPRPMLNLLLSIVAGLFVGLAAARLLESVQAAKGRPAAAGSEGEQAGLSARERRERD